MSTDNLQENQIGRPPADTQAARRAKRRKVRRFSPRASSLGASLTLVAVIALLEVVPILTQPAGTWAAFIAFLYAVVPVAVVTLFVMYIDRWEPEPRRLYLFAFLWGAGVSVIAVTIIDGPTHDLVSQALTQMGASASVQEHLGSSYIAPVVEEAVKGCGVILMCWVFRFNFNGPIDGIVYGAMIGSGFAFTENILYFVNDFEYIDAVFRVRFLEGPLNHEAWTAVFGFFVGFAQLSRNRKRAALWLIPAMLFSVLGHWFNNAALLMPGMTYQRYVFINNVPLVIVLIALIVYANQAEQKSVVAALNEYVAAGWFSANEVRMIASMKERKLAKEWAEGASRARGARPGVGGAAMEEYQRLLLALGNERSQNLKTDHVRSAHARVRERELLERLTELRTQIYDVSAGA